MDLLLWRHAEAAAGTPDHTRELTKKGSKQARRVAAWLTERGPKDLRVLVSPTARTRQTASAFTDEFTVVTALGPGATVAELLAAAGWPDADGAVLVVGHQPVLGQVAARLLSGQDASWNVKKGALWWFVDQGRIDEMQAVLRAVIAPGLV